METIDDDINEFAAYFIEYKAIFGSYPTESRLDILKRKGISLIVDLTKECEKNCVQYSTDIDIIRFPIADRSIPHDKIAFCKLIVTICDKLDDGVKVYVHCKGGHGRSGMVVAAILCYRYGINPKDAFALTTKYHSKRKNVKPYWVHVGCPQTWEQKNFVRNMFKYHDVTANSPFNDNNDEIYINSFLLQTYLGKIVGCDGQELEERRKRLIIDYKS